MGNYPYPKESNVYAMLSHIVNGPTPVEMDGFKAAGFSRAFVSFCESCFHKDAENRSTNKELLEHAFVVVPVNKGSVLAWLREYVDGSIGGDAEAAAAAAATGAPSSDAPAPQPTAALPTLPATAAAAAAAAPSPAPPLPTTTASHDQKEAAAAP